MGNDAYLEAGIKPSTGTSLVVQWLRHCTFTVGGTGSIPVGELRSHNPLECGQKIENKNNGSCVLYSLCKFIKGQMTI